jgi:hypothetical protein
VNQIQASAQPVALGVSKLRGAANKFAREHIAQRAFTDIAAEAIGCRQRSPIFKSDLNAAPLGDAVYESHAGWRIARCREFPHGRVQRHAIVVFYNLLRPDFRPPLFPQSYLNITGARMAFY